MKKVFLGAGSVGLVYYNTSPQYLLGANDIN